MKTGVASLFLFLVYFNAYSQIEPELRLRSYKSNAISENPINPNWDWNAGDTLYEGVPHYWIYFQNRPNAVSEYSIPAPWYQSSAWAGLNDRFPEDGWTLLCRNFGSPFRRLEDYDEPYFALYNKSRSIIRIFILLRNMSNLYSYSTMEVSNYSNGAKLSGVLGHLSTTAFAMDQINFAQENASSALINTLAKSSRWIYGDFPLSYDTSLTGNQAADIPASLVFNIYGVVINEIKMETKGFGVQGDKDFVVNFKDKYGFDSPGFSLNKNGLSHLDQSLKLYSVDINATSPNWDGFKEFFKGAKVDLGFGQIDISNPFKGFENAISDQISKIFEASPIKISGINWGGAFKYLVGGGMKPSNVQKTAPSFISSHYSSTGSITSKLQYSTVSIPIPGARSNYTSPSIGSPIGIVYNNPVGIFTLLKTPIVSRKKVIIKTKSPNPLEQITVYDELEILEKLQYSINAASNLKLLNMEVSLVETYNKNEELGSWLFNRINSSNQKYLIRFDSPAGGSSANIQSMPVPYQFMIGRKLYQNSLVNPGVTMRVKAVLKRVDDIDAQPVVFLAHYAVKIVDQGLYNENYVISPMPVIPPQNVRVTVPSSGGVRISWDRNLENNIAAYLVERSINGGSYQLIGSTADTVVADSEVQKSVKPYVANRINVSVNYRVRARSEWFDDDSTKKVQYSNFSDVVNITGSILGLFNKFGAEQITPNAHSLSQNFPNPFNPSTTIYYGVKENAHVNIKVFNALGQEVATLVNDLKEVGYHYADWNAAGLPSGMYFYRITVGDFTETKKMTLMK